MSDQHDEDVELDDASDVDLEHEAHETDAPARALTAAEMAEVDREDGGR